jgi:hypothetical protein
MRIWIRNSDLTLSGCMNYKFSLKKLCFFSCFTPPFRQAIDFNSQLNFHFCMIINNINTDTNKGSLSTSCLIRYRNKIPVFRHSYLRYRIKTTVSNGGYCRHIFDEIL